MNVSQFWNEYGLEISACIAVIVIFILFIINYFTNKSGTYSKNFKNIILNNNTYDFNNNYNINSDIPGNMNYMQHTDKDSRLELKAKFMLEHVFKRPFVKVRPDFLYNDVTGYNLELDLYNPELKLAIEINGDQHYKFIPFFHRNKDAFTKQRYRDEMKKWKCKEAGITLISVPYSVGEKGLQPYLFKQLRLEGFLL